MPAKYILTKITRKENSPKTFTCQFWEPGLVSYEEMGLGLGLLKKEAMDKIGPDFLQKPVIVLHQPGEPSELFENGTAVGKITDVRWNGETGWYECDFTVDDREAAEKIEREKWSVSCAFDSTDNSNGGQYHAIDYDFEIMDGRAVHLALVPNPRYEDSKIFTNSGVMLINSKKATTVKEPTFFLKQNGNDFQVFSKDHPTAEVGKFNSKEKGDFFVQMLNEKEANELKEKAENNGDKISAENAKDPEGATKPVLIEKAEKGITYAIPKPPKKNAEKVNEKQRVIITLNSRIAKAKKHIKENTMALGFLKFIGMGKKNDKTNAVEKTVDLKNSQFTIQPTKENQLIEAVKVNLDDLLNAQAETDAELENAGTEPLAIENADEEIEDEKGKKRKIGDLMENWAKRNAAKMEKKNEDDEDEKKKKENEAAEAEKKAADKAAEKKENASRGARHFQNLQNLQQAGKVNESSAQNVFETREAKVNRGRERYGSKTKKA